jgi:hypothetical protein
LAKCFICNSRKGQRICALGSGLVCSLCCGETRKKEQCEGCGYFREAKSTRRYREIPRFSTEYMDSNLELQSYANIVEATLCLWDHSHESRLNDGSVLSVIEMLLDKYYFCDSNVSSTEKLLQEGFEMVAQAIEQDLHDVPNDTIIKILGVIYFVAKRRSQGQREYLGVIQQYVGTRVGSNIRVL